MSQLINLCISEMFNNIWINVFKLLIINILICRKTINFFCVVESLFQATKFISFLLLVQNARYLTSIFPFIGV